MDAKPALNFRLMRLTAAQCSCLPMTLMKTCSAHALTQHHLCCHVHQDKGEASLHESLAIPTCCVATA